MVTSLDLLQKVMSREAIFEIDIDLLHLVLDDHGKIRLQELIDSTEECNTQISQLGPLRIALTVEAAVVLEAQYALEQQRDRPYFTESVRGLVIAICDGVDCHNILADALEDAGFDDQTILVHLRRPHHRPSCFAISRFISTFPDDPASRHQSA